MKKDINKVNLSLDKQIKLIFTINVFLTIIITIILSLSLEKLEYQLWYVWNITRLIISLFLLYLLIKHGNNLKVILKIFLFGPTILKSSKNVFFKIVSIIYFLLLLSGILALFIKGAGVLFEVNTLLIFIIWVIFLKKINTVSIYKQMAYIIFLILFVNISWFIAGVVCDILVILHALLFK